jgi:hypothetical protein
MVQHRVDGAALDDAAGVHHRDVVGQAGTTDRSWVIQISAVPVSRQLLHLGQDLAWIVTSSAVVGSSAMIRSGLCSSAMAIATRWRMPPENWCG